MRAGGGAASGARRAAATGSRGRRGALGNPNALGWPNSLLDTATAHAPSLLILAARPRSPARRSPRAATQRRRGRVPAAAAPTAEAGAFPVTIAHKYGETTITRRRSGSSSSACASRTRCSRSASCRSAPPSGTASTRARSSRGPRTALGNAPKPEVLELHRRHPVRAHRRAAARPDPRRLLGPDPEGLRRRSRRSPRPSPSRPARSTGAPRGRTRSSPSARRSASRRRPSGCATRPQAKLAEAAARRTPSSRARRRAVATPYQGDLRLRPAGRALAAADRPRLHVPRGAQDIGGKDEFGGQLSDEKLDLLDVGALLWFAEPGAGRRSSRRTAIYRKLDVRTQGRDVFLPEKGELYEATSFISVLSIPLLDRPARAEARRRGRRRPEDGPGRRLTHGAASAA